jgi:pyridoxamine 5'-phosphate oxidase
MTDDECNAILDAAWTLLETGAASRHSAAHHLVVASLNSVGLPDQRVMILRDANRATATLRFHTDARSPKITQLSDHAPVHALLYDPEAKVQLRLSGTAYAETDTSAADAAWASSTTFARRCYMAEAAPGTPSIQPTSGLPYWIEGEKPSEVQVAPARPNFAIVRLTLTEIDWLHLANSGHRRAQLERNGERWHGNWVVP